MSTVLPDPGDRRILVAWDGSPDSEGALRMARSLQDRDGSEVAVLAVLEPLPVFDTGFMVALPESELYASRAEGVREDLTEALESVGGDAESWPVHVEPGLAAVTIAERVGALGAHLVVTGLGRHRAVDRMLGTETVLQLLHLVHVPLLATPEDAVDVPATAVLAMDFSSFGYRAARTARHLLGPEAHLHLVHVLAGSEHLPTRDEEWREAYEGEVRERLQTVGRELESDPDRTHVHLREGDPAGEILAVSEEVGAGLVAAGSHGHSFLGRVIMGSVSARLVRGARTPLLVVPPSAPVPAHGARAVRRHPEEEPGEPHPWVTLLQDFSQRHAGRRTSLDVEAPEWGARHSGANFPLRGVDYDPRADRIDIMLGEEGAGGAHFTHSVAEPLRVDVVRDEDGRDVALHVETRDERVTLTLHRTPGAGPDSGSPAG